MKNYLITTLSGLTALTMLGACATTGQLAQSGEYDDMYFTASDRNTVEFTELNEPTKAQYNSKGSYEFEQESYSSKNVNPDLIAQYQNDDEKQAEEEADYYVEEYDREDERPTVVNNFYGPHGRYSTFGNPFYNDPFYDPYYSSFYDPFYSSYYDPFWGPSRRFRSGFSMGFGFGLAFGNAWYRPYSPWGWGSSWRNPYYASYYDPYYGGFYNGYWGRPSVVVINNNENLGLNRRVINSRSDLRTTRASDTRTVTRGRTSVADNTANSRSRDSYARNSRTAGTREVTRSYNSLNDRTRRSTAETSRSYNAARSNRGYSTGTARSSDSYTRSRSSAPSRTYSSGRSSSPSYDNGTRRSYGNNRNSGYTPSRSNDSSFGTRSSGSSSRSSGSYSSGSSTRSSGGGTTRGSRGGN